MLFEVEVVEDVSSPTVDASSSSAHSSASTCTASSRRRDVLLSRAMSVDSHGYSIVRLVDRPDIIALRDVWSSLRLWCFQIVRRSLSWACCILFSGLSRSGSALLGFNPGHMSSMDQIVL